MLRLSQLVGGIFLVVAVVVFAGRMFGAPLGNGLANVPLGPTRPPIQLTVWYSSEKERWLTEAVAKFQQTNPSIGGRPIQVSLVGGMGSNELVERVATQDWRSNSPPDVISPASMLQITALQAQLTNGVGVLEGADAPQPLVLTPLVLVGWDERAKALWPDGPQPQSFWPALHDALADPEGWRAHGGQAGWRLVKFGHTSPLTSNSGTQALLLMAYGFHNKTRGLSVQDVQNPEFVQWMREIEQAVPEFGDSTSSFIDSMILYGPGKYDFGMVYENLALQKYAQTQGKLKIFYPPATLLSEHPFVMLKAAWIAREQQDAARALRAFLLGQEAQQLALRNGFRPVNANVSINQNSADNPFANAQASGVKLDLGAQAELPPADVTQALLDVWKKR